MDLTWEEWLALGYEQLVAQYWASKEEGLNWLERLGQRMSFTDELLDFLNETLLRQEVLLRQIAGLEVPPAPPAQRRITAEPQEVMKPRAILSVGTHVCDRMADCRKAIVTIVRIESSLDQDVEIETIGNIEDDTANYIPIGVNNICPASDRIEIILYGDYWRPFVGIRVIAAAAPTAGFIAARVVNQE